MPLDELVSESEALLGRAIDIHGVSSLGLFFHGGKDSVVMLYLMMNVLRRRNLSLRKLRLIRVEEQEFDEVRQFREKLLEQWDLTIEVAKPPIRSALRELKDRYNLTAVVFGARRQDPNAPTQHEEQTTKDWPAILRFSPLLSWSFRHVWEYIFQYQLPYCCLYEQGYTSLGDRRWTSPNPLLQDSGGYLPAWKLVDEAMERAGRL